MCSSDLGLLVTTPVPVPALETVRAKLFNVNVAVTVFAVFTFTVQEVPFTLSQPDHDAKSELAAGAAVRITDVLML